MALSGGTRVSISCSNRTASLYFSINDQARTRCAAAPSKVIRLSCSFWPVCASELSSVLHTNTLPLLTVHLSSSLCTSFCLQGTPQISMTTGKTDHRPLLLLTTPRQSSRARLIPSAVISLHVYMRSLIFFGKPVCLLPLTAVCLHSTAAPAFAVAFAVASAVFGNSDKCGDEAAGVLPQHPFKCEFCV